jgi:hypothetical protein
MLIDILAAQRATLKLKCSGLSTELSLRSVEPSTLSLLGLVRHLADVERRWFRRVLAGQMAPRQVHITLMAGCSTGCSFSSASARCSSRQQASHLGARRLRLRRPVATVPAGRISPAGRGRLDRHPALRKVTLDRLCSSPEHPGPRSYPVAVPGDDA